MLPGPLPWALLPGTRPLPYPALSARPGASTLDSALSFLSQTIFLTFYCPFSLEPIPHVLVHSLFSPLSRCGHFGSLQLSAAEALLPEASEGDVFGEKGSWTLPQSLIQGPLWPGPGA